MPYSIVWSVLFTLGIPVMGLTLMWWNEPFPIMRTWVSLIVAGMFGVPIAAFIIWQMGGTHQVVISDRLIEVKQGRLRKSLYFQEIAHLLIQKDSAGRVKNILLWSAASPRGLGIWDMEQMNRLLSAIQARLSPETAIRQTAWYNPCGIAGIVILVIIGLSVPFAEFLAFEPAWALILSAQILQAILFLTVPLWSKEYPRHVVRSLRFSPFFVILLLFMIPLILRVNLSGWANHPAAFVQKYLHDSQCIAWYDADAPIAFMPGENRLVMTEFREIQTWPVHTWPPLQFARPFKHDQSVRGLVVSDDGRTITSWTDNSLFQWDTATRQLVRQSPLLAKLYSDSIISPDRRFIASQASEGTLVWDTQDWQVALQVDQSLSRIAFSPDSRTLAGVDENGIIHLWDLVSGTEQFSFDTLQRPKSMAFAPDGKELATAVGSDIFFWNVTDGSQTRSLVGPTNAYLEKLTFSPDGRHLVVQDTGKCDCVYIWQSSGQSPPIALTAASDRHSRWTFSPDGRMLAIGLDEGDSGLLARKGRVELWTLDPVPTLYKTITIRGLDYDPNPLVFSSDGGLLAVAGSSETYVFRVR